MENYHGQGGSYTADADGKKTQAEAPTADHPEGNRPRDAALEKPAAKKPPFAKQADPEAKPADPE